MSPARSELPGLVGEPGGRGPARACGFCSSFRPGACRGRRLCLQPWSGHTPHGLRKVFPPFLVSTCLQEAGHDGRRFSCFQRSCWVGRGHELGPALKPRWLGRLLVLAGSLSAGSPAFLGGSVGGRWWAPSGGTGVSPRAMFHPQRGQTVFMLGRHHSKNASPAAQTLRPALAHFTFIRVPSASASPTARTRGSA